jgi:ubiquinone/menaquinone biosynthesis C-methylase UbiE
MSTASILLATPDPARREAFAERVLAAINGGALVLMLSIGHRTGLFDVLSGLSPETSESIARRAGLSERYVREWLGAMVTSRVIEYDAPSRSYWLPPEHAASLTRAARPGNLAVTCQWIPLLGSVEDEVVECFEQGGGVPYASFDRFHAVMAEESDQTVAAVLVELILPIVPGLDADLARGIDVLDVGCGSGRALCRMAEAFSESCFVGYDLSEEAVAAARREARERGLANVRFEVRDVAELDDAECFDLVTAFDAIHDQARPDRVLSRIARALRPSGTLLVQEIAGTSHVDRDLDNPVAPFLYTVSCMHCMTVSLAQGGAGLGAMWGAEKATRMMEEAGFTDVVRHELPHDVLNHYYVARRARETGVDGSAWRGDTFDP